ncbi:NAD(P)-binding protein [Hesseltinella vesiculosa]|uniref:NAD(P)-binding protein n=1 Tax=Hesseltinella vesiculosa TaxID=101127 RepID=A0A1X2GCB5_9FUNG|nr:NAD(P)-binding protein [Hesseltinella vesiculosa]
MFSKKKKFSFDDIPDLSGKVVIITGASSGVGKVSAMEMARKGAHVVLGCRSEKKTRPVIDEIIKETGNPDVEFMPLNLMSLKSCKEFVEEFKQRHDTLHVLMNSAGVLSVFFFLLCVETQVATNYLSHYYITLELLPLLETSSPSRVVNVSASLHIFTRSMNFDTMNDPKKYSAFMQYSRSKAYQIMFTRELNKRLHERGVENVYVNANHPGVFRSDLSRHTLTKGSWTYNMIYNYLTISTEEGAMTQLYLATSPDIEENAIQGHYFVPFGVKGCPTKFVTNEDNCQKLWIDTEKLIQEKLPGYTPKI